MLALPFSSREGVDEYNGVMRFLREKKLSWNLRIVRHSYTADLFREFPIADLSGIICGMDFVPNVTGYAPRYPFDILKIAERFNVPFVGVDVPVDVDCKASSGRAVLLNVDSRQITGRSVRDSIEALRLDNVKRLLRGSVLTHREIAAASGFSSAVYLETVFVKRFGMTMSAYRNNNRSEKPKYDRAQKLSTASGIILACGEVYFAC